MTLLLSNIQSIYKKGFFCVTDYDKGVFTVIDLLDEKQLRKIKKETHLFSHIGRTEEISCYIEDKEVLSDVQVESTIKMPNKAQEDAVINLKSVQELGKQLGFEWTIVASELGFSRAEITQFHSASTEKKIQAQKMLECCSPETKYNTSLNNPTTRTRDIRNRYERSWNKLNKTKILQDALERAGRKDLADKLQCLHWGHQKLSSRVELPSAFPFLITVHKTINNKEGLKKINQLSRKYP
nr:uncharacterized protein LOC102449690 [Pelodiscus sinensis]|eukprot:XP_014429677.1 uncharacterized protein LOC102449690 [Pelodiscus sinensis]